MGAAASTVYYNLKLRHPTLDMPIIDYDLAVLIQPMLMLGVSIGVAFNVIFADWMVTVLLIVLFIGILLVQIQLFFLFQYMVIDQTTNEKCMRTYTENLQAHQRRPFAEALKHGTRKPL